MLRLSSRVRCALCHGDHHFEQKQRQIRQNGAVCLHIANTALGAEGGFTEAARAETAATACARFLAALPPERRPADLRSESSSAACSVGTTCFHAPSQCAPALASHCAAPTAG